LFDPSRGCTSIDRAILTRLIAAARLTETATWIGAHTEAQHDVAALWGGRVPAEGPSPVEVSTEVL
jgi:hypothetical protein